MCDCIIDMCGVVKMKRRSKAQRRSKLNTKEEEKQIYKYIEDNVDEDNTVTRYRLEGVLLYEYNLSHAKMYQVLMNLVNQGIIGLINKSDGEYYEFYGGDLK